jgi:hypothetical protein
LDGRQPARPTIGQWQVERERAAHSRDAAELDFATKQVGQLTADGEAKARAAVFAAGRRIGLLERLEDDPLLFRRDADASVRTSKAIPKARVSAGWSALQPLFTGDTLSAYAALPVNLKALDSRFLSTCCSRLESVMMLRSSQGQHTSKERLRFSASCETGATSRQADC